MEYDPEIKIYITYKKVSVFAETKLSCLKKIAGAGLLASAKLFTTILKHERGHLR